MKKIISVILVISLLLLQLIPVAAMDAGDAKTAWLEAKMHSKDMQEQHQDAKIAHAADPTEENKEEVVITGKALMYAALDEAESWLVWKKLEAQENPLVPEDIRESIEDDVEANIDKIDELRTDVDGVTNPLELGLVFLKMVGKYTELLTDVARNSGTVWVHIANVHADTIADFEEKLRDVAITDEVSDLLDKANEELNSAKDNINDAEGAFGDVKLPGTPLLKFSEGNSYLRAARMNMVGAHKYLNQAYIAMLG